MNMFRVLIAATLSIELMAASQAIRIDEQAVARAQQKIAQQLRINSLARTGLVVTTAALSACIAYRCLQSYWNPQPMEMIHDVMHSYPDMGSAPWLARIGKATRDLLISGLVTRAAFSFGEKAVSSILHPRDIDWYLKTHTSLSYLLKELRSLCANATESLKDHQAVAVYEIYQATTLFLLESLKRDLEGLLGFILYKSLHVSSDQQSHELQRSVQLITALSQTLFEQFETVNAHRSYDSLEVSVQQFEGELTRACNRCAHALEGARWSH